MENVQITLTICVGFDGGIIVYESTHNDSRLVFGGDHKAATEYLSSRMSKMIEDNAKQPGYEELNPAPVITKLPSRVSAKIAERLQHVDEIL